jgi:hypothetical protein
MSRAPLRTIPTHGTRLRRRNSGEVPLEALAAEFALLAQRRGRVTRQIELLDRQRIAASAPLRQVEARLTALSRKMHAPVAEPVPVAAPEPLPPAPARFLPTRGSRSAPAEAPPTAAAEGPERPPPRWKRGLVLEY